MKIRLLRKSLDDNNEQGYILNVNVQSVTQEIWEDKVLKEFRKM